MVETKNLMQIRGAERNLDEVIEGVIILDKSIESNLYDYRRKWETFMPVEGEKNFGKMAYVPIVSVRKCHPQHIEFSGKVRDIPYFVFILNQGRDSRPKSSTAPSLTPVIDTDKPHCKLCQNVMGKDMIISELGDFWLTPNGFPYNMYASLLVSKRLDRPQGSLSPEDIATWMKASTLLNQYAFYNTLGAGASIKEHQHVQLVDPTEIKIDNECVPLPILNNAFVSREEVNGKSDVFRLKNYPVDALIFVGRDAPYKAAYASHLIQSENHAYNILVNKNEVFVIGRNPAREVSICVKRAFGGFEMSGVGLLGTIEEVVGGNKIMIDGAKIFTNMAYDIFAKNMRGAAIDLSAVAKRF